MADFPRNLGELRHINRLRFWPMTSVLKEKYLMEHEDAELLSSFLMPMMHYYPDARATAAELVKHPWLDGVVVQGEVEMHHAEMNRLGASPTTVTTVTTGVTREGKGKDKDGVEGLEEVSRLGPSVAGMVGMGRI